MLPAQLIYFLSDVRISFLSILTNNFNLIFSCMCRSPFPWTFLLPNLTLQPEVFYPPCLGVTLKNLRTFPLHFRSTPHPFSPSLSGAFPLLQPHPVPLPLLFLFRILFYFLERSNSCLQRRGYQEH